MDLESLRHVYLRRVVATTLRALGLRATRALATHLARRVFELNTAGRQRAEARLRDAFAAPADPRAIEAVAAAVYEHLARFWTEALFIPRLLRDSSWRRFVTVNDEAAWRRLAADRRGRILTTAYFGNPAVGIWALGRIFRPVHVVVDLLAQPELRAWQRELYGHRWLRPIDRPDAARQVPDVLGRGGTVAMIFEHERPRGRAVPVGFLGRTLRAYPTIGRLSRWFGAPVGVFTCRRAADTDFAFLLDLHETIEPAGRAIRQGGLPSRCMPEPPACSADRRHLCRPSVRDPPRRIAALTGRPSGSFALPNAEAGRHGPARCDRAAVEDGVMHRVAAILQRAVMSHPEQYYWFLPTPSPSAFPP